MTDHTGPQAVDPRVVVNPVQARQLLAAVTYVRAHRRRDRERGRRLYAFFASLYYGGLRPGEAQQLRRDDCECCPADGWGELLLSGSRAEVSGTLLRIARRPASRTAVEAAQSRGGPVGADPARRSWRSCESTSPSSARRLTVACSSASSTARTSRHPVYTRIWQQAREIGLSPAQAASPLARRPYDLRHAALSSWLAAGVPPTDVAERAGNSVKVLLTVYAKCLDGQRAAYNDRIAALLAE